MNEKLSIEQQVDKYIDETWLPEFAHEFFSSTKTWDTFYSIANWGDDLQRIKMIISVGNKIQRAIDKKRAELLRQCSQK